MRYAKKEWGNTRIGDNGRRIHVSNFPSNAGIDDFIRFFGPVSNLEGITLTTHFAFVQFKRPKDATNAISRHNEIFLGRSISIRPYTDPKSKNSKSGKSYVKDEPLTDDYFRGIKSSRNYRSRSRSRSPSGARSPRRISSQSSFLQSKAVNERRNPFENPAMNQPSIESVFNNYSLESRMDSQMNILNTVNQPVARWGDPVGVSLPGDIELTLKLVVEQKTASNLSLNQINSIIRFFETEKTNLMRSTQLTNFNWNNQSQPQLQPRQMMPQPNLVQQINRAPLVSSHYQMPNSANIQVMPVNVPDHLNDAARLLREAVRR